MKGVVKDRADRRLGLGLAVDRHRAADVLGEEPGVVEAEQVVGVVVREGDRVDPPIRSRSSCRRISGVVSISRLPSRQREQDARPRAIVARVVDVQTRQSQPSMGTPVEVPVPRNTRRR